PSTDSRSSPLAISLIPRRHPTPTLFPYTTLFRSRAAWLEHHVLSFPGQDMSNDDLERFTLYFGEFGQDPFFAPIEGREHIAAIRDRKSTRLNSSHVKISYAVFCLKKKKI